MQKINKITAQVEIEDDKEIYWRHVQASDFQSFTDKFLELQKKLKGLDEPIK